LARFTSATISGDARGAAELSPHPREIISVLVSGDSISAVLGKEGTHVVAVERHEVGEVYVVETAELESDGYWKTRLHIVPALGFAAPQRVFLFRRPGEQAWQEYNIFEGFDYIQKAEGVWLPRRIVATHWNVWGDEPPYIHSQANCKLEWDLTPAWDEQSFTLRIPAGVTVRDKVLDKVYIQAEATDQMIADQVAAAKRLAQEAGEEASGAGPARMIFAACVAVLIAAGLIIYRFKRRRRAR
jgi:hypothetical protein